MKTLKIKIGDKITANIFGHIVKGIVEDIDTHKGNTVFDLDCERFCYASQIIKVESK